MSCGEAPRGRRFLLRGPSSGGSKEPTNQRGGSPGKKATIRGTYNQALRNTKTLRAQQEVKPWWQSGGVKKHSGTQQEAAGFQATTFRFRSVTDSPSYR